MKEKVFTIAEIAKYYLSPDYQGVQSFGLDKYAKSTMPTDFALFSNEGGRKKGAPVRNDHYAFILCIKGQSTKIVGGYKMDIVPGSLHIVPPHILNTYQDSSEDLLLYMVLFRADFFHDLLRNNTLIDELLACAMNQAPIIQLDDVQLDTIKHLMLEMDNEMKKEESYSQQILQTQLLNLIYYVKRALGHKHELSSLYHPQLDTSYKFRKLVEDNYLAMRTVKEYADAMFISPKCLTANVKEETGKSPLYILHQRIFSEAEYLLTYSDLSIKEITERLKFDSASHFSRFFQKYAGSTPSEYRNQMRENTN